MAACRAYSRIRSQPITKAMSSPNADRHRSRPSRTPGPWRRTRRSTDRKTAADGGQQERYGQGRAGGQRALAGEHEDTGADDRADAEHRQIEGAHRALEGSGFGDKLIHAFSYETDPCSSLMKSRIMGLNRTDFRDPARLNAGNQRRLPRNRISVISVRLPGENRRLRLHVTFSRNNRCL